jgi:hypothetical protein
VYSLMLSRWVFLALLLSVGLANAQYARGTFYFQSGATVIAIGAITAERWIFGNVSYTGTTPDYQAFIFDLDNKTITCELNTGNCFKNETGIKRGWHSIRVYLRNSGGENWSEQRYIFMNVSKESNQPIIVMDESEEGGMDMNMYIIMIFAGLTFVGFFYYRSQKKEEEDVILEVAEQEPENS